MDRILHADVVLLVAGETLGRGIVVSCGVTIDASERNMGAVHDKIGTDVIKPCRLPGESGMAFSAILIKSGCCVIGIRNGLVINSVAAIAVIRCPGVTGSVAGVAVHKRVSSIEGEPGGIVVEELCRTPALDGVAHFTVRVESWAAVIGIACAFEVRLVAGVTVCRCGGVRDSRLVAHRAICIPVPLDQGEGRCVFKLYARSGPAIRTCSGSREGVALTAIGGESRCGVIRRGGFLVRIQMAGDTLGGEVPVVPG